MNSIRVVDSHTGGEPTRVIVEGGPDLGAGDLSDRLRIFRERFDHYRSCVVNEPRGSDVMVGALYVPADASLPHPGVIFFNNVGYLGMCGHGTIGLMVTLRHLGILKEGTHTLLTPVGPVVAQLRSAHEVSIENVPSFRKAKDVSITVDHLGEVTGDIAWGGNWFYLVHSRWGALTLGRVEELTEIAWKIRKAINAAGYPEVDHIELFDQPIGSEAHSRNFVLCPGKAYDRSPCGTGTSAKLACLAADRELAEREPWIQESILGSQFIGNVSLARRESKRHHP